MEKDIGKIKKNDTTDIIIRIDEYKGKKGLTIREFVTSEGYTGFSKSGTRIPSDEFLNFRDIINTISLSEITSPAEKPAKKDKKAEKKVEEKIEEKEEPKAEKEEKVEETEEEKEDNEDE